MNWRRPQRRGAALAAGTALVSSFLDEIPKALPEAASIGGRT